MTDRKTTMILQTEIDLPYVEGGPEPTIHTTTEYDDAVVVYVEHSSYGVPAAILRLEPPGPSGYFLLGFDPAGLRKLGHFLVRAGDALEQEARDQRASGG